jgi:hypothetical protein
LKRRVRGGRREFYKPDVRTKVKLDFTTRLTLVLLNFDQSLYILQSTPTSYLIKAKKMAIFHAM